MNILREFKRHPRGLIWLSISVFVNRMGTMALPFLALFVVKERGVSFVEAGGIVSLYALTQLLLGPIAGWLGDKVGKHLLCFIGFLVGGAFCLLLAFDLPKWGIVSVTVMWALFTELARPQIFAMVSELSNAQSSDSAFAIIRLASNMGMAIGPLLGGVLASVSYPALFLIDGVTSILAAILLLYGKKELPVNNPSLVGFALPWQSWRQTLSDAKFRYFLLAIFPVGFMYEQLETTLAVYMNRNLGLSEIYYGSVYTVNTAVIILLEFPILVKTAHWGRKFAFPVGATCYATGFLILALTQSGVWILIAEGVSTFGEIFLYASGASYVSRLATANLRASYMALFLSGFTLDKIIAPPVGLYLLGHFGASSLWGLGVVLCLFSACLLSRTQES